MSRVGQRIKEERLKLGLTQKALAKKLGVAEKFVNEVETGRKVVSEGLINKASKVFGIDLNDVSMVVTDEDLMEERKSQAKTPVAFKATETNELWNDAFASVLKNVPIYDYNLNKALGAKELPIHSNKVEGFHQDKVCYIKIQGNDMSGFRMLDGDMAFSHLVKEISNGFFLLEYKGERRIRQVRLLGNSKALLISNGGTVLTETMELRDIKVIAKIERLEITL